MIARVLLPQIKNLIREETKNLRTYIDDGFKALDEKIGTFDEKFKAFDDRLLFLRNEMNIRFYSLENKLNELQGVAVL
ncbi:MAG: hypothetical protein N3G77_04060 [Nitrososphaeria archaeon]|nr:hypothetical protein [Nitrososphaeria archaeon]